MAGSKSGDPLAPYADMRPKVETGAEIAKRISNLKNQIAVNAAEVVKFDLAIAALRASSFHEFGGNDPTKSALLAVASLKEERSRALERIGLSTSVLHEIDHEASMQLIVKWRGS